MKKIGLLISLLCCALFTHAQNDVKVRFGVEAGFNMSKWAGDYETVFGTSFKPSYNFGGLAEIQLNQRWSIQPELLVSIEGTKTDGGTLSFFSEAAQKYATSQQYDVPLPSEINAIYLKVPVFAYYSFSVGPGRLSPGLGVYLGWGVGGKTNGEKTFSKESYFHQVDNYLRAQEENNSQFFSVEDQKNRDLWYNCVPHAFDYGLGFKCMYEMEKKVRGLFACLGVTEGLTGAYNLNVQFSLGYKWQYNKWLRSTYNTGILEYNP